MSNATDSDRIEKLEMAVAFQEETIEALNSALLDQAQQIAALKREIGRVSEQVGEIGAHPALSEPDKRPPHY